MRRCGGGIGSACYRAVRTRTPESLKGYEVTVRHEGTGRACRLSEGRFAHDSDAGRILCND